MATARPNRKRIEDRTAGYRDAGGGRREDIEEMACLCARKLALPATFTAADATRLEQLLHRVEADQASRYEANERRMKANR